MHDDGHHDTGTWLHCIDTMNALKGWFRDHHQVSALGCSRRRCSHHAGHGERTLRAGGLTRCPTARSRHALPKRQTRSRTVLPDRSRCRLSSPDPGCRKAQTVAHSPGPVRLDVDREVGIVVCVGRTEEAKAGQRPLPALLSSRPTQTSMQIAPYDFLHRCKERRRLGRFRWRLAAPFLC
jgi:hypothetical protein